MPAGCDTSAPNNGTSAPTSAPILLPPATTSDPGSSAPTSAPPPTGPTTIGITSGCFKLEGTNVKCAHLFHYWLPGPAAQPFTLAAGEHNSAGKLP